MLETATHILFEKLAIVGGIYLIWDAYIDLSRNSKDRRALIRGGIGIATIIVDYVFLKSFGG